MVSLLLMSVLLQGTAAQNEAALSQECTQLFGDEAVREENRNIRVSKLHGVFKRKHSREIVHSSKRWQNITPLRTQHIRFEGVELFDGQRRARLSVKHPACGNERREYLVSVDDALGRNARVLALLPDGILVENRGRLTHLSQVAQTDLRLIWRSPFLLTVAGGGSGGNNTAPNIDPGEASKRSAMSESRKKAAAEKIRSASTPITSLPKSITNSKKPFSKSASRPR